MSNISVPTSFLTGLIAFSLLYGVYFVLFMGSLYVLLYKKTFERVNPIILGGAILQFILITVCYGIRWDRIYVAFIVHGDTPNGPLLFLNQLYDWREVVTTALWTITGTLGDILFIYRVYIVWDSRLRFCLVPLVLLIGSLVATVGIIVELSQPATMIFSSSLGRWVYMVLSLNLIQNILVNVLIIARIWGINARNTVGANLWPVIVVLMESGALYSSSLITLIFTYAFHNNAATVMTDMTLPIMGIAFNIIIIRVTSASANKASRSEASSTLVFIRTNNNNAYPLNDLTEVPPVPKDDKGDEDVSDRRDFKCV